MNYNDWINSVPKEIMEDVLWTTTAYRYALFLSDLCWIDVTKLMQDQRTLDLSNQLYRAAGSISANIAEGYSRSTGKDRARFYEYALGSARESRDWYFKARHILGESVTQHRSALLTEIIRLLITTVPRQRQNGSIREERAEYHADPAFLLNDIPLP